MFWSYTSKRWKKKGYVFKGQSKPNAMHNLLDAGKGSVMITKNVNHLLLHLTTNAYFKAYEPGAFNVGIMDNGML